MRKYLGIFLTLLIMVLVLFPSLTTYANSLPEQSGLVTDPIGLFSQSEKTEMEKHLQSKPFEVIILTSRGLNEFEGERLANKAYDEWGLNENQLMLVITIDPNYVHLVFDHLKLKDALLRTDIRDAKGLIDEAFVPLAMEGRVADGVIAVSELVNSIIIDEAPKSNNTMGKGSTPNSSVSNNENRPLTQPIPKVEKSTIKVSPNQLFMVGMILILILSVFFIANLTVKRRRILKKLSEAKQTISEASSNISRTMVSNLLKELELGFIQGATKLKLKEIEQAVLKLHQNLQTLETRLREQKIPLFALSKVDQQVNALYQEIGFLKNESVPYATEIEQLEQTFAEIRRSVERAKERAEEVKKIVEAFSEETGYSLKVIRHDLQQALEATSKADQLDEFDFLSAGPQVELAHKGFDQLLASVEEFRVQVKQYQGLPMRIKEREEEIRAIVGREQLLLTDGDPFAILEQVKSTLSKFEKLIQEGNTNELRTGLENVETQLAHTMEIVHRMIANRDHALQTIRETEQLLTELSQFEENYKEEVLRLQNRYATVHIQEQEERYRQIREEEARLESLLIEIRSNSDVKVQKYQQAYTKSQMAQESIYKVKNLREQIFSFFTNLEVRLKRATDDLLQIKGRFYKAATTLEQLNMQRNDLAPQIPLIEERLYQLQALSEQLIRDLYQIEGGLSQVTPLIDQFYYSVEQLVRKKEEADRSLRELHDQYTRSRDRYGRKINVARYTESYQQVYNEIRYLISIGLFDEAMKQLPEGREVIHMMEREYNRAIQEERRRNMNWPGGGSSGSSGWGGGGGRSSGSSGWGGSSRSSGSSSWGGGSRSSGSSGWGGSRGGRSSGSSKW